MTAQHAAKTNLVKVRIQSQGRFLASAQRLLFELAQRIETSRELNALSDQQLRDIGLTKPNVNSLRSLPFGDSGAEALSRDRKVQSGNW